MTASATRTAGRKTLSLPPTAANLRAARKQGEEKAPRTRRVRKPGASNIWIDALVNAGGMHRDALQLELAVGLSFYASKGNETKVALKSKKEMREVYEGAGYACRTHLDEDYKTVARRIGVSADLYLKLGGLETIQDWTADVPEPQQVGAIMAELAKYKFSGLNSVLAWIGKPAIKRPRKLLARPTTPPTAAETKAASMVDENLRKQLGVGPALPPGRVFKVGPMEVGIPFEATYQDVMSIVDLLTTFAKTQMVVPSTQKLTATA